MENILFIDACVRENSRTRCLAHYVLSKLQGQVRTCHLEQEPLLPLNAARLAQRDAYIAAGDYSDTMFRWAKDFAAADTVVIAAPYWELSFPSLLKIWIENIAVTGLTFAYGPNGPVSLCHAKRLVYVTTAGGPIFADLGFAQVEALSQRFFHIDCLRQYSAENLDIIGADVASLLNEVKARIDADDWQ